MGANVVGQTCGKRVLFKNPIGHGTTQRFAMGIEEDVRDRPPNEGGARLDKILLDPRQGHGRNRHPACLAALACDSERRRVHIHFSKSKGTRFCDAEPSSVDQLHECPVPHTVWLTEVGRSEQSFKTFER